MTINAIKREIELAGFIDQFQKSAQKFNEDEEKPGFIGRLARLIGGTTAGAIGAGVYLGSGIGRNGRDIVIPPRKARKIIREFAAEESIKKPLLIASKRMLPGAGMISERELPIIKKHLILTSKPISESTLLHELGHARQFPRPFWQQIRKIQKYPIQTLGSRAGLLAALSGYGPAVAASPFITAAGFAPQLAEEAGASATAIRHLFKKRGPIAAAKAVGPLGKAFLTYASIPAALALGPAWVAWSMSKEK